MLPGRWGSQVLSGPSTELHLHLRMLQIGRKDKWRSIQCRGVSTSWGVSYRLGPLRGLNPEMQIQLGTDRMGTEISTLGCWSILPHAVPIVPSS